MYTKMPDDWLEIDEDEDMLESRAFYELMQAYRHSQLTPQSNVIDCFEDVKEFIRGYFNPCQEIERLREEKKTIIKARDELYDSGKLKCTCSGFVLQYEGGCCCDKGKGVAIAESKLWKLIESLQEQENG